MLNIREHSPRERCTLSMFIAVAVRSAAPVLAVSAFAGALVCNAEPAAASYPYYNGIGQLGPLAWTEQTNVSYAYPSNGSNLDKVNICAPNPSGSQWSGPYPAIMLIHGGGWDAGTNAISTSYTGYSGSWCQLFASWGFVAYSVGYRLQDGSSGNAWPAQLIDVQAAIRWVRARAAGSNPDNVNPSFVGAMGDSAGGSLALQVGSIATNVVSSSDPVATSYASKFPKVQFMVSQFGPYTWGPNSWNAPLPAVTIPNAENGSHAPASSLFIHGNNDTVVSPSQSIDAYCELSGAGSVSKYLSYSGGHEYSGISSNWNSTVGSMIMGAVSFAMAAGHYAPSGSSAPIPTWFASPGNSYNQSNSPSCN